MIKQEKIGITSFTLHIIAMLTMLIDHMYQTLFNDKIWMNGIGRLSFPIFAFMIVEGYYNTKDVKKYLGRLLIFAFISEIPFDLMISSTLFFPNFQNVIWTFLISLCAITLIEKLKKLYPDNKIKVFFVSGIIIMIAFSLAMIAMTDYLGYGVLTVFTFYFFRGKKWWQMLGQIIMLILLNVFFLGAFSNPFMELGNFEIPLQSLALFSLIIIWLYNGKRGYNNKYLKYSFYAFYPTHMLILSLIMISRY